MDEIATINNTSLRFWDLRSMKETFSLDFAHAQVDVAGYCCD